MKSPFLIGLGLLVSQAVSPAAPIAIESQPCTVQSGCSGLGFYTGTLDYAFTSATDATLTVSLTNSLTTADGGKITAFAFNNPSNLITGVTLVTDTNLDTVMGGATYNNTISANPLEDFDIGASLDGDFEGGGSPNSGILVGQTGLFTFTLTGTGLNGLTTQSFVDSLNATGDFFAVRFRGFANGGSDKVRADIPPDLTPVPEPQFYAVLLAAGLGLLVHQNRRRKMQSL